MEPKPWYTSRTIWLNAGSALVSAAALFVEAVNIPEVRAIIPQGVAPYVMGAVAVINLWLRTRTSQPVGK